MNIKAQIEQDIKKAMLAGDKILVTTLRGLKSSILYAEVAKGVRDEGLSEAEVISLLSKESKKRQESAEMYAKGGSSERSEAETKERHIIDKYLPVQLNNKDLEKIVVSVILDIKANSMADMGKVIGVVKDRTMGKADGFAISKIVKEKLSQ